MKFYKTGLILLLAATMMFAQFVDVDVKIETQSLKPQEKSDLEYLETQIRDYIEDYEWIDNKYNIAMPIRISMFIQEASLSGSERSFSGQLITVTQSNDLQLFEKQLKFYYSQSDALMHTQDIQSLSTILDFYAYFIIGAELDTYEPLGGASIFERARNIATRAQMSNYSGGWRERQTNLDEYLDLRYFRQYKFYYWSIIDLEANGDLENIPDTIDKALYYLEEELRINNRNRFIHLFLDAHAEDLADLFKLYGNEEQQEKIIALDSDNSKIYKKVF